MEDRPLIAFPQFFPQATLCRLVSLTATRYWFKKLIIVSENRQNRVRQIWIIFGCKETVHEIGLFILPSELIVNVKHADMLIQFRLR
jgi:hypothetical protein